MSEIETKMLDAAFIVASLCNQYEALSRALRDIEQNNDRAYYARTEVGLIGAKNEIIRLALPDDVLRKLEIIVRETIQTEIEAIKVKILKIFNEGKNNV